jgi:hypothetical protein
MGVSVKKREPCPICTYDRLVVTDIGPCHLPDRIDRLEQLVRDLAVLAGTTMEEMIERRKLLEAGG